MRLCSDGALRRAPTVWGAGTRSVRSARGLGSSSCLSCMHTQSSTCRSGLGRSDAGWSSCVFGGGSTTWLVWHTRAHTRVPCTTSTGCCSGAMAVATPDYRRRAATPARASSGRSARLRCCSRWTSCRRHPRYVLGRPCIGRLCWLCCSVSVVGRMPLGSRRFVVGPYTAGLFRCPVSKLLH